MKKKLNPKDPALRKIMEQMQNQFMRILEQYCEDDIDDDGNLIVDCDQTFEDDDEAFECGDETFECGGGRRNAYESKYFRPYNTSRQVNEMAVMRAVNPKALANVRDMISRRDFNEDWATSVKPLPKYDDPELLNRYVAALLVFHKPCPKTMEEVDEIGVFKNYAHKMLDGSITFEDIQKMYSGSPALAERPRKGTARGAKGFRKNQEPTQEAPSADFNFDDDQDETPTAATVTEPEFDDDQPLTTDEIPGYEDVDDDNDDINIPDDDISDLGDEDEDDDEELPAEVAAAISDETEEEVEEEAAEGEIIDIDNIEELTVEEYYDPNMNASFHAHNEDNILMENGKVGFEIRIVDENGDELGTYMMLRDSFGKALEDYTIATQAAVIYMSDKFYDLQITRVINVFYKSFNNKLPDEQQDELDVKIQKFYYSVFQSSKNVDDIIAGLDAQAEDED